MYFNLPTLSATALLLLSATPVQSRTDRFVRVDASKRPALDASSTITTLSENATITLGQAGQPLTPGGEGDSSSFQVQHQKRSVGAKAMDALEKRAASGKKHKKKACKKGKKKGSKSGHKSTSATVATTTLPTATQVLAAVLATTTPDPLTTQPIETTTSTQASATDLVAAVHVATTHTSSSSSVSEPAATTAASSSSSTSSSLVSFVSSNCGASGANTDQPNGSESFLNCGINGGGWTPPAGVTLSNIAYVTLENALASNSVWEPCKQYVPYFEKYGQQLGIPPILLASFALQESTCNANTFGDNGGAIGLMQITAEKCGGLSTTACADPDYNIRTGATYFKNQLDSAGGNLLTALGTYNGWYPGMTYGAATSQMYGSCCQCQQNLDYLYQMLNGWVLGKTGYELGSIGNLKACSA